jgi:hypothetical protein
MAKKPLNQGKPWTNEDVSELDTLAQQNTPTRLIAIKMGRTLEAIYRKAKQKRHFAQIDRSIALRNKEGMKCRVSKLRNAAPHLSAGGAPAYAINGRSAIEGKPPKYAA